MRQFILFLGCLAAVALGAAPAAAQDPSGQVLARDGSVLEDLDYRFRLSRPARGWTLLPEERSREVSPDSLAAAHSNTGMWGAVIAEEAPGLDLEAFRDTIFENIGAENKERLSDERGTLGALPAWRILSRGEVNGVPVFFRHVIVARGEFVYQIVSWTMAHSAQPPSGLELMESAFSFLDGPAKARRFGSRTRDQDGIGWRVRSGAFESAAYRLRVTPPEGWRLVLGDDLQGMSDDAEVGLEHAGPEAYLVVVPEMFDSPDSAAIEASLRRQNRAAYGEPTAEKATWSVLGQKVEFESYAVNIGIDVVFWWGVVRRDRTFYQVLGWYPTASGDEGRATIEAVLGGIQYLGDEEARALVKEMDAASVAYSAVGAEFALRRGRYQHFGAGYALTTPPGFWRVSTGQSARAVNEAADLVIEDPERGLLALVILDPGLEADEESYHHLVVEELWSEQTPPESVGASVEKVGAATARSSAAAFDSDGLTMWYRVTTLQHRGTGIQVHAFGHIVNRARIEEGARMLLKGLELPEAGLAATQVSATAHEDHRLGFRFRTSGSPWRLREQTPPALAPIGTLLWGHGGEGVLLLMGLHAVAEGQDEAFMLDLLRGAIEQQLGEKELTSERNPGVFAGQPAVRLTVSAGEFRGHVLLVQRGRLTYLLMHGREDGKPLDPELEQRLQFLP